MLLKTSILAVALLLSTAAVSHAQQTVIIEPGEGFFFESFEVRACGFPPNTRLDDTFEIVDTAQKAELKIDGQSTAFVTGANGCASESFVPDRDMPGMSGGLLVHICIEGTQTCWTGDTRVYR